METTYAQALWKLIDGGMPAKKAVKQLSVRLAACGRSELLQRIGKAFARIAEREQGKKGIILTLARERDERKALHQAKDALKEMGVERRDLAVKIDDTLIGGWRLEGREKMMDESFKKHLLSIYNRATK